VLSLAVVEAAGVILAMVYIAGLLTVEKTGLPVVVVITDELKPGEDNEVCSVGPVVDDKVKLAVSKEMIPSAAVELATDTIVDRVVVDLRNRGPGVEREVVEEILGKNIVLEGTRVVVVVKLSRNSVLDLDDKDVTLSTVERSTDSPCEERSVNDVVTDGG